MQMTNREGDFSDYAPYFLPALFPRKIPHQH